LPGRAGSERITCTATRTQISKRGCIDRRPMPSTDWRLSAALRLLSAVATMGAIFALSSRSSQPKLPGLAPDLVAIAGHVFAYAVLAILIWWGLPSRLLTKRQRVAAAFLCAVAFAVSDEWHQSFILGREPTFVDLALDVIGAACGLAILARITASASWQPRGRP